MPTGVALQRPSEHAGYGGVVASSPEEAGRKCTAVHRWCVSDADVYRPGGEVVQQRREAFTLGTILVRTAPDDDGVGEFGLAGDHVGDAVAVVAGGVQAAVAQVVGARQIVEEPGGFHDGDE